MSDYPGTIDSYNVITGGVNYMDEAGYVLHERLNNHGSAIVNIETVLGTTAGTSVVSHFDAGEKAVQDVGGTLFTPTFLDQSTGNKIFGAEKSGTSINSFVQVYSGGNLGYPQIGVSTYGGGTSALNLMNGGLLNINAGTIAGSAVLDEDDMASDSDAKIATQQSIKAYVDTYGLVDSMPRQAIMNGNFDIWQRGTSFTPASTDYMADRWRSGYDADGGTLPTDTITRQSLTPGDITNSFYYMRLNVDGAGSGFGTDALYTYQQPIEFGTRFLCGASKTVTLSFWAKSDITDKKLGFNLWQLYGTGGTPSSAEAINGDNVTLTSTWTKYTHTFTTNTLASKTFGTDNNDQLRVDFSFMWGATRGAYVNSSGTAEDFGGSGNIDIAQVQLCAGSVALPFQPKSYAQELQDCQRYCEVLGGSGSPGYSERDYMGMGYMADTDTGIFTYTFKQVKRTAPTITAPTGVAGDDDWSVSGSGLADYIDNSTMTQLTGDKYGMYFQADVLTTTTAGLTFMWNARSSDAPIIISAEL